MTRRLRDRTTRLIVALAMVAAIVLPRTAPAGDQFDKMRANSVAMLLHAGALPGHLTLVEQQVIQAAAKP